MAVWVNERLLQDIISAWGVQAMTEYEWSCTAGPKDMLGYVKSVQASERKLRLFAIACCRHLATDTSPHNPIYWEAGERCADGLQFERLPTWLTGGIENVLETTKTYLENKKYEPKLGAAILRNIFGNPFKAEPEFKNWANATIQAIGNAIYEERDFTSLPILADALEDAGCDDATVLAHLRGKEPCPEQWRNRADFAQRVPHPSHCECGGSNWIPLRGVYCKGDWVLDGLLGRK